MMGVWMPSSKCASGEVRPLACKLGVRLQQGHKVRCKGGVTAAGLCAGDAFRRDLHKAQRQLGFIGALLIIILFILLIWRGITLSLRAKDKFGMLLGIGLTSQVGMQVILNIMVVTNTIPNTGISLPFFSYGGTSLIILLIQMGIVLSISRTSAVERS